MAEGPIFILEDEMLIALDMQMTLGEADIHDVILCRTSEQARAFLETDTPRLAFLDINLGGGETSLEIGIELVSRGCRVVLISGYSGGTLTLPCALRDAPRLSKPFVEQEFLSLVAPV